MSRHLYAVGDTGRLGPEFLLTIRSSSALRSVTRVASVDGLHEAIGEAFDADAMVLICDEPAGGLVSLAERIPVVVCSTDKAGEDNLAGHPFIHWVPHLDDPERCVRSLLSLVDQVWSARLKQFDLKDEAERAHRFFAVLANATTEGILVFREGRVVHVNDSGCRILGSERAELIGSRPVENVPAEWRRQVEQRMAGDGNVHSFLYRRPDGSTVPIRVHGQNVDIQDIRYRVTSFIDLSRESPVPYTDDWSERELYGAEAPVVWVRGDGHVLYMNSVMRRMLLMDDGDPSNMRIWEIDEELDETTWPDLMDRFREHGTVDFRTHVRRTDGSTFHILVHARHRLLGEFEYVSASFEDVSTQIEMRRSVAQSRQRLGLALEAATLGLWEWSVDTDTVSLSPELEEMIADIGPLPTSGVRALLRAVDRRDVRSMIDTIGRAVETHSRFSVRCRLIGSRSGATRWLECWGDVHLDDNTGESTVLGAALDITDRKRRLQEFQLERERFRAFADGSLDGFFLLEARLTDDGVIDFIPEYVNDVVGSIIGVDPSLLIGMSLRNDCPVSLRVGIGDTIARAYTTGEARESEFQVDRSSGDVIWLRVQAVPYSKGVGVVVRDVTERRRREAELAAYREQLEGMVKARTAKLRRSEAEFRSVVESARDIMGIVDENHNYLFVNQAARSSRQETVVGRRAGTWVLESHQEAFHNEIDRVFETSEERRLEVPVEWSDGSVRWMDCRFSPVSSGGAGVEAVTVICRDVTEQREAQEQIRELNRDLEQRVEDRIAEIRALIDTSRRLAALMDEDAILNTVTETLLSVIPGALGVAIWSRESGGSPYGLLRYDGSERTDPASDSLDPDGRILEHVNGGGDSGSAVLITADDDATELTGLTQLDSCRTALATKISDARGLELIVAVAIDEKSTAVDERSRSFIDSVAAQAAVAVNNARLFREIRAVSVRLLHVQENERRDVAHELHDQVGGLLTSLQFLLQASKPEKEAGSAAIAEARQMVKTLMEEVRSLTLTLRPALLDDFGLVPALEGLISRHRKQGALDVDLECDFDRNRRFPADVETAVYRVVQEALTNVIRHAETGRATVELSISDDRLEARIRDDGKGFDVDRAVTRSRSMGVRGMIERVELLEGRARIDTHPGQGTRVQFHVPLHPNGRVPS